MGSHNNYWTADKTKTKLLPRAYFAADPFIMTYLRIVSTCQDSKTLQASNWVRLSDWADSLYYSLIFEFTQQERKWTLHEKWPWFKTLYFNIAVLSEWDYSTFVFNDLPSFRRYTFFFHLSVVCGRDITLGAVLYLLHHPLPSSMSYIQRHTILIEMH